jgi:hypothetical protein
VSSAAAVVPPVPAAKSSTRRPGRSCACRTRARFAVR